MNLIFSGITSVLLLRCGWTLFQAARALQQTTLTTAIYWARGGWFVWLTTWGAIQWWPELGRGMQDQLWYWTAVMSVVPPIAVLGAKRPGYGAWNAFVLVPLVLVLGWPALTVWTLRGPGRLQVETPALVGFVLALVMGYGNYLSTRLALPAVLCVACVFSVLTRFVPDSWRPAFLTPELTGSSAVLCLTAGCLLGEFLTRRAKQIPAGPNRVWSEFREAFGIVWAKRCLDRINIEFADREHWPAQLGPFGLEWSTPDVSSEDQRRTSQRLEYALHWMLRRFVDPPWIESRLHDAASKSIGATAPDSLPPTARN